MVEGLGFLMVATKDENAYVRHTTLWCIGQIFLYLQGIDGGVAILTPHIQGVLGVLKNALADTPSIATRACFAICELSACYEGEAQSPLTPYFQVTTATMFCSPMLCPCAAPPSRALDTDMWNLCFACQHL